MWPVSDYVRRWLLYDPQPFNALSEAGPRRARMGHNYVERADGTREQFDGTHEIGLRAGDVFVIEKSAGGYGVL